MTYVYLSGEDVLGIAGFAVEDRRFVVRDVGLVAAAAHRPSASPLGQEAYTGLFDKAAAFLQSLLVDRPFDIGNRRTAWTSCVVFLALNDVQLRPDIDAAERLVIAVASGSVDEVKAISEVLRDLAEPSV
ncbi:type II toxin-antitoxin system death-on-curing family toxin [Streptomyces sp. AK08-02]|uniref:type II toxin-antitoxin system death-on-curing family toxin n=1 Tax=Streptomyces sp. AK08-02 TaxID=3028654 RepID=UPI0029B6F9AC|nr:Fic family protein [Streptomyces sp. AK08-02]MDX3747621.1 type II toxin-antitoxin system death-on-curing family toxin [Streptomyces sp. AK08-02]